MARDFNGSDQYGQAAINLSSFSAITAAFWLWIDARTAASFDMYAELGAGGATGSFAIYDNNNASRLTVYHRGTGDSIAEYAYPTLGQWNHIAFTGDFALATNEVNLHVNGVLQTPTSRPTNTNNDSGSTYANSTLNFMARNAASLHGDGKMQEVGIWGGVTLSTAEIAGLAKGTLPSQVRPASLAHYWPMMGRTSPEPYRKGTTAITLTNSPAAADHRSMIRLLPGFARRAAAVASFKAYWTLQRSGILGSGVR